MEWLVVVVLLLVLGVLVYREWNGPSAYRLRIFNGRAWTRAFPDAPREQVWKFLQCFVEGIAFSSSAKLSFRPNDQVLDVYRALYGGGTPQGDETECEPFLENLEEAFGRSRQQLLTVWRCDVTLGELFAFVRGQPGVAVAS